MQKQELLKKPVQFNKNELLNEDERLYRGWASVEIRDSHGDLLKMDVFKKIMPVIMDRGGIILDSHSNRPTGKIINYEFSTHPETNEEGLMLTVKNHSGYKHDDNNWDKIKNGEFTGFSFGGMALGKPTIKFEDGMDVTKILNEFEGFEFSNVENPANAPSIFTEINYLAKSGISKSEVILKKTNILYNSLICKNTPNFIYQKLFNKLMPLETPQPNQPAGDNSETRLAALEEAVGRILEMLQSNVTEMKSKEDDKKDEDDKDKKKAEDDKDKEEGEEKKKEEDVSQKKVLPKDATEKIQDSPPASNPADDKVKLVEKELSEIKKTLAGQDKVMKELSEIKKLMEANKSTTPKPMDDGKGIQKNAVVRPKNFADANKMVRGRK